MARIQGDLSSLSVPVISVTAISPSAADADAGGRDERTSSAWPGAGLAARHSDLFGHIAIGVAGYAMSDEAKIANRESARLLSEGRKTEAASVLGSLLYPDVPVPATRVLAALMARIGYAGPYVPNDVLAVAEATNAFDGRAVLPRISLPVLLVCGDRDRWFAKEVYEETARLIPDCTLKLYPGKDHAGAMFSRRFPQDVLDFVRQHPHVGRAGKRGAGAPGRQ